MYCPYLRNIPPNVISTFTRLEELYLPAGRYGDCQIKWEVEGVNILDELKNLRHLTALEIRIPDANVLPKCLFLSKKLERYEIIIGNYEWGPFYRRHGTSRMIILNLETSSCCDDVQKFLSVLDGRGFPELEYLHVQNSSCFRTVVDYLESESCHHFLFLELLSLHHVLNLERIHNHQLSAESFCRLRTIIVEFCHKLKNVLSFSTYKALPLLQKVHVTRSDNMEEIFAIRSEKDINNGEGMDQIEFMQLRFLKLKSLPKLISFCSINGNKNTLDTPTPLFNQKVAFPSLEEIEISEMDDLEMIWPNQLYNDSFCNLNSLEVKECNKLLTIFQSNMLERIARLESLTICHCELVEQIFDLQGVDFENLHSGIETLLSELDINGLPKLKHIWNKDPQKMFSYKKLSSVKVNDCMSMKYLFPISIAESLSELEQLRVYNCGVEEIVGDGQGEVKVAPTFVFPQITSLKLKNLPRLKTFYRGVYTSQWQNLKKLVMRRCDKVELFASSELLNSRGNNEVQHDVSVQPLFIVDKVTFPSLEEIKISESNNLTIAQESFCNLKSMEFINCASVEEIFDLQKVNFEESYPRAVTHHQLQKLYIKGLPKLKQIWNKDPQAELSFKSLQQVEVSDCQSLKDIFPASIARNLSQLVKLDLENCGLVEEIVAMEGEAKASARFVFPKVTSIRLNKLPQLRTFYPGVHSSKWLFLKELEVISCDKIELLASQLLSFQENNEESHLDKSAQPLFLVEKDSFPNLEKLKLRGEAIKILQSQFSEQLFCNLKFLEVYNDKSVIFPICILQRLRHMKDLRLQYSSYKEIFSYDEDKTHVVIDSRLDMVLQKLECLMVYYCVNLIQVVPSSASFQNLTFFRVWSCNGLKNMMTSSTAKSLVQLREMEIEYCKSMIEVVAKEGDVTEDEIVFGKLRTLTLADLPSLSCFCSGNYSFELPSLEQLTVKGCPEMKYFSSRDVTTPILQKVKRDWSDGREYTLEGDLNTTIQQMQDSREGHPYNWKEEDFWDSEDED
ncbi:hypothetical protein Dsin_023851 [Dipteronia sinensis]|uniref:Disease resistance protein At4g27190-like leucine-rich repeats domain-containing protein n=1 Tax=Dipteronia sinensis TaxID=43782 RepID=A0AAE0A5N2_9ROSI|nr:hypothetical protein Dsin_023851 [Dipteronia sinensis]